MPVKKTGPAHPPSSFRVDVLETADGAGSVLFYERYEAEVSLPEIDHGARFKTACEVCDQYGKNFACPPFSPTLAEYFGAAGKARVICVRLPQEYFPHAVPEERYTACFKKARELLTEELLAFRRRGLKIAGSGPCLACSRCSAQAGGRECVRPEERIYSLESLGANLIALTERCFGIDLEWGSPERPAAFICALGAVLLHSSIAPSPQHNAPSSFSPP